MKNKILQLTLCLFACMAISNTLTAQDAMPAKESIQKAKPVMTFTKKYIDIGTVKKGETRTTFFEFTNTGNAALEIDLISACDCTTTDYPRGEILPGESGRIDTVFDSTEKDESEVIDVDIFLKQIDETTGGPIIEMLQYEFVLEK